MAAQPNQLLHYLLALDQTRAAMRNPNGATPPFVDPQQQQQPGQPQPGQQPSNIVNGYRQMGNNYYQLGKGIAGAFKKKPAVGDDTQSLDNNPQGEAVYGEGGIAFGPTHALVGDDNEPEYIVPESKVDDFAAETAATGKPPDPSKIPGKDEQNFTPLPQSMRPPMLAAPGQAPQTPPPPPPTPQQAGPPAMGAPGQLPPVPSMAPAKKPGIGARILGGISGFYGGAVDASGHPVAGIGGAIQGAEDPGRKQRFADYGMQTTRTEAQAKLAKEQADTAEAGQRGKYYEAQAQSVQEEGKLRPIALKDGSLYDPKSHSVISSPKTIADDVADFVAAGYPRDQAMALAATKHGGKPADMNAPLKIDPTKVPASLRGIFDMVKPGPDGTITVTPSMMDKVIENQAPKAAPINSIPELYRDANNPTSPSHEQSAGALKQYRQDQVQQALASRPPSNADTNRADKSYQFNIGELNKVGSPVEQLVGRMGRLQDTLAQNSPQADALVAPELLTVMAGGQGSGLRMNEAEISRIVGGRSNWETLKASINKWQLDPTKANSITPAQRQQIRALVSEVGNKLNAKQQILEDARQQLLNTDDPQMHRRIIADARQKVVGIDQRSGQQAPPTGGTVKMRAPNGQVSDVPQDQVEHFKQKGAVVVGGR